jgi:hypothetical protein
MLHLTPRDIEILKLLERYRYLRRTFIHALLAAPLDQGRLRHRIYKLKTHAYLTEPERQKNSGNYRYTPRVYELGPKGREELNTFETPVKAHEFWHELMICDVLSSIEVACLHNGLKFEILPKPNELPTTEGAVRADAFFKINDTHFLLEADRSTESNSNKWEQKILKYADIFKQRTYQSKWNVMSLIVLCMFISPVKANNVRLHIESTMGKKSRSLWFRGAKALGSHDIAPKPIYSILDDPWQRAGHAPSTILSALERRPQWKIG